MKCIIGLGNPGDQYENTWHNVGFIAINKLSSDNADHCSGCTVAPKLECEIIEAWLNNEKLLLIKPQTFMNNSGRAVQKVMDFYKITADDVIVIHDEIDLPIGSIKISHGASAAGHRGVESIIQYIGTNAFTRIRVGIAPEEKKEPTEDYVLRKIDQASTLVIDRVLDQTPAIIESLVTKGITETQNAFN